MRTDEGVCPYFEESFLIDEGTSLIQGNAFFDAKKRPLHSKETPPLNGERRSLVFSPAIPANEARLHYTSTSLQQPCKYLSHEALLLLR